MYTYMYVCMYVCIYVCMYVCVRMVSGKLRISETWMMDRMKIPGMSNVIDEVHTDTGFLGIMTGGFRYWSNSLMVVGINQLPSGKLT